MSNLHDRGGAVNLIKAALAPVNGVPLFKGDVAGHEFRGNQWKDSALGHGARALEHAHNPPMHAELKLTRIALALTQQANNATLMAKTPAQITHAQTLHRQAKAAHLLAGNSKAVAAHDKAAQDK